MPRLTEKAILESICKDLGTSPADLFGSPLTGFMAMIGKRYKRELFVVGRAVNGWTTEINPDDLSKQKQRNAFVEEIEHSVTKDEGCPMLWVTNLWSNKEKQPEYDNTKYNTNKSAFWRVIRSLVGALRIADIESPEWPSHLIWSNLYKFAPADGGNPSALLCERQFAGCKALFLEELRIYEPKRLLLLTGLSWAKPFLEGLSLSKRNTKKKIYVEGSYDLVNHKTGTIEIVVASHPQGKPEQGWLKEVIDCFHVDR